MILLTFIHPQNFTSVEILCVSGKYLKNQLNRNHCVGAHQAKSALCVAAKSIEPDEETDVDKIGS